ncbi:hypothetical protein BU26DRAFT_529053 [Trematosphaeria pertusa]|uniref:Uncharacterized protein n=1 Tax=Trematosphaeria pertusa TaxID=390896 RepID=A0A6A6IPW6_9PLEO|nr:uncharacterized protein BU26DRAFT_529053 [Trematosphaeria pertusa]KAF2251630.1 hypothetical protein BU26DRAFT_529053 [Trematosphaeria pertusa]
MAFLPIFLSSALLSALSISNLGLISSMVGFLHKQKDDIGTYQINWPGNTVQLVVEPQHLWVDQGHTSNGVAGYGFFLGLFGLYVAWRQRKRQGRAPSKTLLALFILQLLAVLFTLSALIFVFVVTNQTKGQHISESIARSNIAYPADKWTPETWFTAVLELPMDDHHHHDNIHSKVVNMRAWRWMLIPIFLTDILAFGFTTAELARQRKGTKQPEYSAEK